MKLDQCYAPGCTSSPYDVYDGLPLCANHAMRIYDAIVAAMHESNATLAVSNRRYGNWRRGNTIGWIYYIRVGDRIKIGYTTNLKSRFATYPPDTQFLAAEPGTKQDEAAIHQLYQSYRATGREWYGAHHQPLLSWPSMATWQHSVMSCPSASPAGTCPLRHDLAAAPSGTPRSSNPKIQAHRLAPTRTPLEPSGPAHSPEVRREPSRQP